MSRRILLAAILIPLAAPSAPAADKALDRAELKKLQGKWLVRSMETPVGKQILGEKDEKQVLEVAGTRWIFTGALKGKITALDPKKKPAMMEIVGVEPGDAGVVDRALYRLEGDTLTVCLPAGEKRGRPRDLASPPAAGTGLIVFHRLKKQ